MHTRWLNAVVLAAMLIGLLPMSVQAAPAPVADMATPVVQSVATQTPPPEIEIEPEIFQKLAPNGNLSYLIYFRDKPDLSPAYQMNWIDRGRFVAQTLQETAQRSQAGVRAYLDAQGIPYQAFWVENVIAVDSSSRTVFDGLLKYNTIAALRARRVMGLIEPERNTTLAPEAPHAIEPNIVQVQAPEAWDLGINGAGMVVANVDTGVRYTHQALVQKYRGTATGNHNYNWWDPYGDHPTSPADDNGHGSHTMGTMVGNDGGANQIGIAPGAQWIACRACNTNNCTDEALLECGQWIAAPWDLSKTNPDPDKRPNVVNNSWGDCSKAYDPWYQGVVDAWQAAGVYPVFSNGNASNCAYSEPPGLNTVGNPGRYGNVTGVGSSGESNGLYASHSNWGPTDNLDTINAKPGHADLKPQVIAPGVSIRSSTPGSDTEYQDGWSGTSMSAPHVTGLVAMIWQAAPCLVGNYADTELILEDTVTPVPYDDGTGAGAHVPNYASGWGEINALAAVQKAKTVCGDARLQGTVTENGVNPLPGVLIKATRDQSTTLQTMSNMSGTYSLVVFSGTYTIDAVKYGYVHYQAANVTVVETTTHNIGMTPLPASAYHVVSGKVSDATTNWPLYAKVAVVKGVPLAPPAAVSVVWTDPTTGVYSFTLAEGMTYTLKVTPWFAGYSTEEREVAPLTDDVTQDFPLEADTVACMAPGYSWVNGIAAPFNDTVAPAGWTVVDNVGNGQVWAFDDPGGRGNLTGGTGGFAIVDSDDYGSGGDQDTELRSPALNLSNQETVWLEFDTDFRAYSGAPNEVADVDVSVDGGVSWENVWHQAGPTSYRGPAHEKVDLSALVAGEPAVTVRFHYYNASWDYWWQIDNVKIGDPECLAPTNGGLVVGNVYDANASQPIVSAGVANDLGMVATTAATPDDPMTDDAFYALYSPAGAHEFTALMEGYGVQKQMVTVAPNAAVRQNFYLPAGQLTLTPDGFAVTLEAGQSIKRTATLANTGGVAATYLLAELPGGYIPMGMVAGVRLNASTEARRVELALGADAPVQGAPSKPWAPTGAVQLVLDDGSTEDALGLTAGGQFIWLNRFTPTDADYPFTLDQVSLLFGDTANVGEAMELVVWEDADGNPANGAVFRTAENVTVQANDGVTWNLYNLTNPVFFNGPGDVLIGVVNRDATGTYPAALDTNASQGRSWVGIYSGNPPEPPTLPPDDTFTIVDDVNFAGNWTLRGSGVTGAGGGIPWLAETPVEGVLDPGASQSLLLTFDASVPETSQPGDYYGTLQVGENTPYDSPLIPVTLTVKAPATWGQIAGQVNSQGYCDAAVVPLEGAQITLESWTGVSWAVQTDAEGRYSYWLDPLYSPVTVTVAADAHLSVTTRNLVISAGATTTHNANLELLEPCFDTTPEAIHLTFPLGLSQTTALTLSNAGAVDTSFSLQEKDQGFMPLRPQPAQSSVTGRAVELNVSRASALGTSVQAAPWLPKGPVSLVLDDGSTEDSVGVNSSSAASQFIWLNRFTPDAADFPFNLQQISVLWPSGQAPVGSAIELVVYADTDGDGNPADATYLGSYNVTVQVADGTTWSNYTLNPPIEFDAPGDVLLGVIDRFVESGVTPPNYPAAIDTNNSAGRSWIGWWATDPPSPPVLPPDDTFDTLDALGLPGNLMIRGSGQTAAADVPWLTETPTRGVVLSNAQVLVDVTLDSADIAQPGEYYATLKVRNEDARRGIVSIPVTMTLTPPATWGKLTGVVSSLGNCDSASVPLVNAEVLIEGASGMTWTVTTDLSGTYKLWLDAAESPVAITVSANGHTKGSADVTISAGATTTQDFALRVLKPCLNVQPSAVSASLAMNTLVTQTVTVANTGATPDEWRVTEAATWLTVSPVTGVLAANTGSQAVALAFDSAQVEQPGVYTTLVMVSSDAPNSPVFVPVTMTVQPPATWGKVNGAVTSLGHCDTDNRPLANAELLFQSWTRGTVVTLTDALVSEGFEDAVPPTGWVFAMTDAADDPGFVRTTSRVHSGSAAIYHDDAEVDAISWAILPQVTVPAGGVLRFWQNQNYGTYYSYHGLWISTGTNDPADFVELAELGRGTEDIWEQIAVDLSAYVGQSIYLAFRYEGNWADEWFIDDVVVGHDYQSVTPMFWTTTTDDAGMYGYWLEPDTYTVTVMAADHFSQTQSVVLTTATSPTLDFALTWDGPCVTLTPTPYALTLPMGSSGTLPLTLTNSGSQEADFALSDALAGFTPAVLRALPQMTDAAAPVAGGVAAELFDATEAARNSTAANQVTAFVPQAVLYDNGPLVNSAGTGAGGADESMLQGNLGMTTLGANVSMANGFRMADDFTVTGSGWYVDSLVIFAYQTGSSLASTFTGANLRIWDGVPGAPDSQVIFGDTTTNRLINTTWSGIYRVSDTSSGFTNRPIMANTVAVGIVLPPGTYWVDWQAAGTLASGPWAPPITINGMVTTGNALQYDGTDWVAFEDDGLSTQQGIPFLVQGEDAPWLLESPITGTVAAGNQVVASITMDAAKVAQPGEYRAYLVANTSDLVHGIYPVTMTVTLPAFYGELEGLVNGLGACDLNPTPLANAVVFVEAANGMNWAVSTDISGTYSMWVDATVGPLTVTVSNEAGYVAQVFPNVTLTSGGNKVINANLRRYAPCLSAAPTSMEVTLTLGMSATQELALANSGALAADFNLVERSPRFTPLNAGMVLQAAALDAPDARVAPAQVGYSAPRYIPTAPTALFLDEGFEDNVVPPTGWAAVVNNANTWAWSDQTTHTGVGKVNVLYDYNQNEWLISPEMNLGEATLSFWSNGSLYWCRDTNDNCDFNIWIVVGPTAGDADDILVGKADEDWTGTYVWTQSVFNLTPLLPGGPVRIGFQYEGNDGAQVSLDDVLLDGEIADVAWLTETPVLGQVLPEGQTAVSVTLDSAVVDQPGTYQALLQVKSNDLLHPVQDVTTTMHVTPPAGWGHLYGTILKHDCISDTNTPFEGATVQVSGPGGKSWTLVTDATGGYSLWLPQADYTVNVTANGYETLSERVWLAPGTTIIPLNFILRTLTPCLVAQPTALNLSVEMGMTKTLVLELENRGAVTTSFGFVEQDRGRTLLGMQAPALKDAYGYTVRDSGTAGGPRYKFVDLAGLGNPIALGDDSSVNLPLGFDFVFYGNTYSEVYVNSNGLLSFGAGSADLSNDVLPDPNAPNNIIAAMWDDLTPASGGKAYYQTFSDCPYGNGACFIVEYENFAHVNGDWAGTFEVIIFRNGSILVEFADAGMQKGAGSTTGIENFYGSDGITYAANTPDSLKSRLAVCFAYPGQSPDCVMDDIAWLDLETLVGVLPGDASNQLNVVFDASIVEVDQPGTYFGTLVLSADNPLMQQIPVTMTVLRPASMGELRGTVMGWTHCDNAGTPARNTSILIKSADGAESWGLTTSFTGTYSIWLDSAKGPFDITVSKDGYVTEVANDVTVAAGATPTTLNFDLRTDAPCFNVTPAAFDFSVTRGNTRTFSFELLNDGAGLLNIFQMTGEPWMTTAAITQVAASTHRPASIVFDSTGMAYGVYHGALVVSSNDPAQPQISVPVTMTVVTPTVEIALKATPDATLGVVAGRRITYTISVTNTNDGPVTIDLHNLIPVSSTYVLNSATNGLEFIEPSGAANFMHWQGVLGTPTSVEPYVRSFSFAVTVEANAVVGSLIQGQAIAELDGQQVSSSIVSVPVVAAPITRFTIYMPVTLRANQ